MATDETEGQDQRQRIAAAVQLLLVERGLSQGDLAAHLKIQRGSLNRSLNLNSSRPRPWRANEIAAMAVFFRVPSDFFFDPGVQADYEEARARVEKEWEDTVARVRARIEGASSRPQHA